MTTYILPPTEELAKVLLSLIFGAWVASSLTGCGVQVGTTDYWEQYNRALRISGQPPDDQMGHYTEADKRGLNRLVERAGRWDK